MRPLGTGAKFGGLILSVMLFMGGVITGGILLDRMVLADFVPAKNLQKAAEPDFKLISEAWNLISKKYVDRQGVQTQKLTYGAISGMVNALGDTGHSSFLNPEMKKIATQLLQGNITGIGVQITIKEGSIVVQAPLDGSPAQKAGIQAGDIILRVNGEDITGFPLEEAVIRIAGKPGTSVTLTILNAKTGQSRDISIVRAKIPVHNVSWQCLPGSKIAHLRIAEFSQGVAKEVRKDLGEIVDRGLTGIILDLRNNTGGVLDEAVGTASQFLKSGTVVLEKNSKGVVKSIPVEHGGLAPGIPLVVLINFGTAERFGNCGRRPAGFTSGRTGGVQDFRYRHSAAEIRPLRRFCSASGHSGMDHSGRARYLA